MGRRKHTEEYKDLPVGISLRKTKRRSSNTYPYQVIIKEEDRLVFLGVYYFLEDAELALKYKVNYNKLCKDKRV